MFLGKSKWRESSTTTHAAYLINSCLGHKHVKMKWNFIVGAMQMAVHLEKFVCQRPQNRMKCQPWRKNIYISGRLKFNLFFSNIFSKWQIESGLMVKKNLNFLPAFPPPLCLSTYKWIELDRVSYLIFLKLRQRNYFYFSK